MNSVPHVAKPTARRGSQSYARAAIGGGMSDAIAARMEAMEVTSKKPWKCCASSWRRLV